MPDFLLTFLSKADQLGWQRSMRYLFFFFCWVLRSAVMPLCYFFKEYYKLYSLYRTIRYLFNKVAYPHPCLYHLSKSLCKRFPVSWPCNIKWFWAATSKEHKFEMFLFTDQSNFYPHTPPTCRQILAHLYRLYVFQNELIKQKSLKLFISSKPLVLHDMFCSFPNLSTFTRGLAELDFLFKFKF